MARRVNPKREGCVTLGEGGLSTTQAPETTGVGNMGSDGGATEADPIQQ